MGRADYLKEGDWNAVCAECGMKGKASEMLRLPDGIPGGKMYVHPEHYVARNPQDFVRGIPEKQSPPWSQPMPEDEFSDFCTTISAVADYAIAECALSDYFFIPDEGAV